MEKGKGRRPIEVDLRAYHAETNFPLKKKTSGESENFPIVYLFRVAKFKS